MSDEEMILMGRISGLFGLRGWVKIYSHTSPRERILDYSPWFIKSDQGWQARELRAGQRQGKGILAQLEGCDGRDQAADLVGCDIAVLREQLPKLTGNEYYWTDLQGLKVENLEGAELGQVSHLFETGANDVLVVKGERERLIPYIWGEAVCGVDLEAGLMIVDWDPDF